ncbi:MAG: hypothetical protein BWX68_03015 [Verrucomicrobia bacterium ADurb.Bin063]|nr:MAG: hypothetical protein BWX68_03015 [Verrucomicrobia bacterium ADurb.Bin063]
MRTAITLLVITSLLLCGLTAVAQQEAAPGTPTDSSVEAAPGAETVEGAPGTPTDSSAEAAPGDSTDTEDVEEEDKGNGGGNVDQNPPNPPVQPVERRTVVVRQLAAAHAAGDQAAVRHLSAELKDLNERLAEVEANPLGGTEGQRSMWGLLHDAGVVSESHLRTRYGLVPVSAPESQTESIMPATPAKGREDMPLSLQIVLGAIALAGAVCAIVALTRGNNLAVLAGALGDAANRAQNNERLTFSAGPGRMRLTVEPANATPLLPPAPAPAPAYPQQPLGQALVPVQVTANPVVLNPGPQVPAQPSPAAPVPAAPAPQAQPVQVWFNNNLQGAAPPQAQPQARQPQAPQGQQQRQPRQQPAQRQQGGAQPPAPGAGAPPAQGGGQPPAGNP